MILIGANIVLGAVYIAVCAYIGYKLWDRTTFRYSNFWSWRWPGWIEIEIREDV